MSKKENKKASGKLVAVINIVCVVLMVAFLVCHFLPFWTYEAVEGEDKTAEILGIQTDNEITIVERTISLADFVWFTEDHEELFEDWEDQKITKNGVPLTQNDVVVMPFLVTLISIFGVIFCLLKRNATWTFAFPLVSGILGVNAYLTVPVYQIGQNWQIHLVAAILLTVAALVLTVQWAMGVYKWFTVKKH